MNAPAIVPLARRLTDSLNAGARLLIQPKEFCFPDNSIPPADIYAFTDRGLKRDDNQDSFLAATLHVWRRGDVRSFAALLVADGMGGGRGGDLAAAAAVETAFFHVTRGILAHNSEATPDFSPIVRQAVEAADAEVRRIAAEKRYTDMGTTLVMGVVSQDRLTIGNMGDSRLYKSRNGRISASGAPGAGVSDACRLVQETEDHSLVGEIVKSGMIDKAQARTHKLRSAITRAVGQGDSPTPDIFVRSLAAGETAMLCTDGVHGVMNDAELEAVMQKTPDLRVAAGRIMQTVLSREAPDNFTLVLYRAVAAPSTPDYVRLPAGSEGKVILRVRLFGETASEFEIHVREEPPA
ncbi:serine/threonine-protein phosphatase [bacterium]|nr:serine/threonine-protein phosphatase [bacterium]